MEKVRLLDQDYLIFKNEKDGFNLEEVEKIITDYFSDFDYILGDWSYGKLRLKGFNSRTNPNFKSINDIDKVDDYLKDYCAYGCKYFILAKDNVAQ